LQRVREPVPWLNFAMQSGSLLGLTFLAVVGWQRSSSYFISKKHCSTGASKASTAHLGARQIQRIRALMTVADEDST
jgi:hypothetical protein